jgi:hypothetical protein
MSANRPGDVDLAALAFVKAYGHDDTEALWLLLNDTDLTELCLALALIAASLTHALAQQDGRDPDTVIDGMQTRLVRWFGDEHAS